MAILPNSKVTLRSINILLLSAGELVEDARNMARDGGFGEVEVDLGRLSGAVSDALAIIAHTASDNSTHHGS
jgi:hypothetical protein